MSLLLAACAQMGDCVCKETLRSAGRTSVLLAHFSGAHGNGFSDRATLRLPSFENASVEKLLFSRTSLIRNGDVAMSRLTVDIGSVLHDGRDNNSGRQADAIDADVTSLRAVLLPRRAEHFTSTLTHHISPTLL